MQRMRHRVSEGEHGVGKIQYFLIECLHSFGRWRFTAGHGSRCDGTEPTPNQQFDSFPRLSTVLFENAQGLVAMGSQQLFHRLIPLFFNS